MGLAAPITPRLNTSSALSRGLVYAWSLLGTHRNLVDRTGDLSPGAAAGWTASPWGRALDCDGTADSYLDGGDNACLDFGTGVFSVSCLFRADASASPVVLGKDQYAGTGNGLYLWVHPTAPSIRWYTPALDNSIGTITLGKWHHVVVARRNTSSGGLDLYLDGLLTGTGTDGRTLANSHPFRLGAPADASGGRFDGAIGAVKVWDRVLSAAEVRRDWADPYEVFR